MVDTSIKTFLLKQIHETNIDKYLKVNDSLIIEIELDDIKNNYDSEFIFTSFDLGTRDFYFYHKSNYRALNKDYFHFTGKMLR